SLSGWYRNQHHATSTSSARTRGLPALLMPCSLPPPPLSNGVGAKPAAEPTCRRFLNSLQEKNSAESVQAVSLPTPHSHMSCATISVSLLGSSSFFSRCVSSSASCF